MKEQNGFTIIELLLVIGIVGILSGILVTVIDPQAMRARARDSQRISDLRKIQVALELYFSDNVIYPTTGNYGVLDPNYIDVLPQDPSTGLNYFYESPGSVYTLVAELERNQEANGVCGNSGYNPCYGLENP